MNVRALLSTVLPILTILIVSVVAVSAEARAACGCMLAPRPAPVPKQGTVAQAKIVNKASKVVLVRDGDATTMTLANDFVGAPVEFGLVVPVPTVIQRKDVKVVDDAVFAELERQTAPRLVETEDPDPCAFDPPMATASPAAAAERTAESAPPPRLRASDYGVKVESHFFAGEYEIAVLSGTDSSKLVEWLQKLDYDVPDDAAEVLGSYIRQKMYFFVARVHVKEMGNKPRFLRPIQVTYRTPKFMLPVRLGMVNADGPQELLVFTMSRRGRVEPTNYRTLRLPTGQGELPAFVKDDFNKVYDAAFAEATKREDMRVVFVEAVLPVAAPSAGWVDRIQLNDAVKKSGARFLDDKGTAWTTRMHFRYDKAGFPEDLVLQETADMTPFIARFNSRRHHLGPARCEAHRRYLEQLPPILDREAQVLANLTGWSIDDVRAKLPKVTR